jgi:hypothetical protein
MLSSVQILETSCFFFVAERVFSYSANRPLTSLWSARNKAVASCALDSGLIVGDFFDAIAMMFPFNLDEERKRLMHEQRDQDDDGNRNAENE